MREITRRGREQDGIEFNEQASNPYSVIPFSELLTQTKTSALQTLMELLLSGHYNLDKQKKQK
jgi:hypothetical protein